MPMEIFAHLTHAQVDAVLTVVLGFGVVALLGSTVCFWLAYRPRNSRNVPPTEAQVARAALDVELERRRLAGLAAVQRAALVKPAQPTDDAATATEFAFFETSWGENGRVM